MHRLRVPRRVSALLTIITIASGGAAAVALRKPEQPVDWRAELLLLHPEQQAGRLVQPLSDGGRAELTLDPALQRAAQHLLADADPVQGSAVAISVADGRVLALAGWSRAEPDRDDVRLALAPWAPAASVFKLVTVSALIDAGVAPDTRVCYHGGVHSVEADNLEDDPDRDGRCRSLTYGLARSQNAIIARLAHDHLDPARLTRRARAFGFGTAPSFELPVTASQVTAPTEPLAFARFSAGFWNSSLSPLHGAIMAATIARGGEMPGVHFVDRIVDGQGRALPMPTPGRPRRVLSESTADQLGRMMIGTTEWGSARRAFLDYKHHRRRLGAIRVAGKTGTLDGKHPALAYSWFVGFAPADHPQVAVAVLLGREDETEVKAATVARELLASWFTDGSSTALVATR
jgi:cell division protein FtsI/penicillin-binding protein 2